MIGRAKEQNVYAKNMFKPMKEDVIVNSIKGNAEKRHLTIINSSELVSKLVLWAQSTTEDYIRTNSGENIAQDSE